MGRRRMWDFAADPNHDVERQLLPEADILRLLDRQQHDRKSRQRTASFGPREARERTVVQLNASDTKYRIQMLLRT